MWRLLEARMRPELPMLAAAAAGGVLAGGALVARFPVLRTAPERLACAFGLAILMATSLYRWSMLGRERRESRLALLVTLPIQLSRIAAGQLVELVAWPLVVAATAVAAGVLGRVAMGGAPENFALWLLAVVTCSVLAIDQLVLMGEQLWAKRPNRLSGNWMIAGLVLIFVIGALGAVAGGIGLRRVLSVLEMWRPFIVSGYAVMVALALILVLALANHRLFLLRPDFTD